MPRTPSIFGAFVRRVWPSRLEAAQTYLRKELRTDDPMALIRARAESAQAMLQDTVLQETIQLMNESIVGEIATGNLLADEERRVLFLKLQLVSEFQEALLQHINEYETQATIREAERRQEHDDFWNVRNG